MVTLAALSPHGQEMAAMDGDKDVPSLYNVAGRNREESGSYDVI
jgi:hypothetical protein